MISQFHSASTIPMNKVTDHVIVQSLEKLRLYIEAEEFKGYDPYDTLTSPFPFHWFTRYGQAIATQVQKRNPINIRPLLGIKKDYNPKGMGLLLHGYVLLQKNFPEHDYSAQIQFIFQWLKNNRSKGFTNACWGYNFGWASPEKYLPPFAPTVVATSFIATGIYEYHQLTGDPAANDLLISIGNFITQDLPVTETENGICFSYSPFMKDCCYNASLLGAETLARIYSLTGNEKFKSEAYSAVEFVVSHQHNDGHWKYKINPMTGKERHQVDFHQGYIIDSISNVMKYCNEPNESWTQSVEKGLKFYKEEQFFIEGQSKWRIPKIYPVEIHNQSQGIITFSAADNNADYLDFAGTILHWTIKNMQDKDGFFYYRKLKSYTNKISFMRWSNAWMFLATCQYINAINFRNK
jgi:Pectic acid lyase